jgi:adenylosuccinate lyase
MISHTHGQPASPTTFGKEIRVFKYRLLKEIDNLKKSNFSTKFGGAVGNFNAHYVAYPKINWSEFSDNFIQSIGLTRNQFTTQISNYEEISYIFDTFKRINSILIDLNTDIWTYISKNYLKQKINENEVGSSTMPHKINPINFENSEGNLIIANSLFEGMSRKLPISRLQRDLTDSTILRNIGIAFGYSLLSYKSLLSGLNKIEINKISINNDIEKNYVVIAEAIQTILRREGFTDSYEKLKEFTRKNENITSKQIQLFINQLDISENIKNELLRISVHNYIGNANFYSH